MAQEAGQEGLRAEGLVRRFGGVAAVDSVSIALAPGEIVAVIGPNGAGKSTLFDLLSGVTAPDAGRLLIGVVEAAGLPPHRIARLDLSALVPNLTTRHESRNRPMLLRGWRARW